RLGRGPRRRDGRPSAPAAAREGRPLARCRWWCHGDDRSLRRAGHRPPPRGRGEPRGRARGSWETADRRRDTGRRGGDEARCGRLGRACRVAASATLTGAEAAFFSLGRARLRRLAGSAGEARSPLIERPHDLLVTLLVGITLINIGAAALAATLAEDVFGARYGLLVEIIGMILILTTFGEVLPMTFAVKYPEQFLTLARG